MKMKCEELNFYIAADYFPNCKCNYCSFRCLSSTVYEELVVLHRKNYLQQQHIYKIEQQNTQPIIPIIPLVFAIFDCSDFLLYFSNLILQGINLISNGHNF